MAPVSGVASSESQWSCNETSGFAIEARRGDPSDQSEARGD